MYMQQAPPRVDTMGMSPEMEHKRGVPRLPLAAHRTILDYAQFLCLFAAELPDQVVVSSEVPS